MSLMSHPRSPPGPSGRLRRSRNSPSSSASVVAERDLSAFLGMAKPRHRAAPPASPGAGLSPQTPPSFLSRDAAPRVPIKPTFCPNQQFDHNNNGEEERETLSGRQTPSNEDLDGFDGGTVVLETCTLVPDLKPFSLTDTHPLRGSLQGGVVGADLEEIQISCQTGNEGEEKAVVWCVTGVCEAAGEHADAQTPPEDQGDRGGNPRAAAASLTQPANEKAAPEPISSQPVPASRGDDLSLRVETPQPSIRTLTTSEKQGMRRVVPISRAGRASSSLGKPASSSAAAAPGQRGGPSTGPSTGPSSRHFQRTPDPRGSKDQKGSGTQESSQEQNQALQRRSSIRKTFPKAQAEEKMCRSTLRALRLAGGSVSAPASPRHKASIPSSSPPPGFARSTAASSFRRSHAFLAAPATGSPKSSPSSTTPSPARPFVRTESLRVSTSGRSSDGHTPLSSPPLRVGPRSLTPTKAKSTHSKDSGKAARPNWR